MALTGEVFPSEVYSWIAVFVMPVNAALNPFLYTFSNILTKKVRLTYMYWSFFRITSKHMQFLYKYIKYKIWYLDNKLQSHLILLLLIKLLSTADRN
jgi:hypothetical protein